MSATVMLFDPTAPQVAATATGSVQLTSLAGAVIGFIDNAKPNFHHLVDDLADIFTQRYGVSRVIKQRKSSASIPADPAVIAEMAKACDLVITGSGD
jgi:hypothetical protein